MTDSLLVLLLPPLALVPAMGVLSSVPARRHVAAELRRKALHAGIGVVALAFPALLRGPLAVSVALGLIVTWLVIVRRVPALRQRFGACLFDCGRLSPGDLYYALALAALLLLPGDPLHYTVPVLVLAFADAAAALAGRLTPPGRRRHLCGGKTVNGTAAFIAVAFLVSWPPLLAIPGTSPAAAALAAVATALAGGCVELVARRGLDNLLVPLAAWLALHACSWAGLIG